MGVGAESADVHPRIYTRSNRQHIVRVPFLAQLGGTAQARTGVGAEIAAIFEAVSRWYRHRYVGCRLAQFIDLPQIAEFIRDPFSYFSQLDRPAMERDVRSILERGLNERLRSILHLSYFLSDVHSGLFFLVPVSFFGARIC